MRYRDVAILFMAVMFIHLFIACSKDLSSNNGWAFYTITTNKDSSCANSSLSGIYYSGIIMNNNNKVSLESYVSVVGNYGITTSKNGISFILNNFFTTLGQKTLTLQAYGTPIKAETDSFYITNSGNNCFFTVTVQQGAEYTLSQTVYGTDSVSVPYDTKLGVAPTSPIYVFVKFTKQGQFYVYTPVINGLSYSASGTCCSSSVGGYTLNAVNALALQPSSNSIPTLKGPNVIPVYIGNVPHNIVITVN